MPAGPSETRRVLTPLLARSGIVDPRAYLWTAPELDRLAGELGLTADPPPGRRPPQLDQGCGGGSLGVALARRVDGLWVDGVDLDPELLTAGRGVLAALGLRDRVRLREGDLDGLEAAALAGYDTVACQAVLVHMPRPDGWLAGLVDALPAGTAVAAIEADDVARARGIRDSVTDGDPEYGALRVEVARAVTVGARQTLGVDRRVGGRLDGALAGAGLSEVRYEPVAADALITPPYDPEGDRARWFAARLSARREGDPVDRMLALAGGMSAERFGHWEARRRRADERRLGRLAAGDYRREEAAGWFRGRGVVSRAR